MKKLFICCIIINILLFFVAFLEGLYIIKYNKQIVYLHENKPNVEQDNLQVSKDMKYPIDIELKNCCAKNFMTAGMNECTKKAIKDWNKEILITEKQIKRKLNSEQWQLYKKSDNAWKNYFEREKDFLNNSIGILDGDIHTTFVMGFLYELAKTRAINLKSYTNELNEE